VGRAIRRRRNRGSIQELCGGDSLNGLIEFHSSHYPQEFPKLIKLNACLLKIGFWLWQKVLN